MTVVKFKPFAPSQYMFGDLFEELFNNFLNDENNFAANKNTKPAVNIIENEDNYDLELAIPGIKKENIDIKLEDKQLIISSKSNNEEKHENDNFIRMEYNFNSFKRVFTLPETVNHNNIDATYADGILRLKLNKKEEAMKKGPVAIEIK
ncbi:MAG: Hsp20/alpha crystallin family protein [Saprospiraceae bacterium]